MQFITRVTTPNGVVEHPDATGYAVNGRWCVVDGEGQPIELYHPGEWTTAEVQDVEEAQALAEAAAAVDSPSAAPQ